MKYYTILLVLYTVLCSCRIIRAELIGQNSILDICIFEESTRRIICMYGDRYLGNIVSILTTYTTILYYYRLLATYLH
jgi:hypothetical protein